MGVDDVASAGWVSDKSPFFTTLELTQRLDLIFHLIENIEIIPLIRGAEGGGKSTLAMRVRQAAPANWSICLLEADSAISPERLLANISRYFGWIDQQTGGLEGLVNCFEIMRDEGQVPVLLIDDAQRLSATAMITLLRLFERQRSGEPLVSIVLFGDEHINLLLATPQLRIMTPQAIQIIDLPRLNREDATRYMRFILQHERVPADMAVDEARLTRLYRRSKGLPGPLRQSILNVLGESGNPETDNTRPKSIPIVFATLGLIMLGTVLLFQDRINLFFVPSRSDKAQVPLQQTSDPTSRLADLIDPSGDGFLQDQTSNPKSDIVMPRLRDTESDSDQLNMMSDVTQSVSRDTSETSLESRANEPQTTLLGEYRSLEDPENQHPSEVSGEDVSISGRKLPAVETASGVPETEPEDSSPATKQPTETSTQTKPAVSLSEIPHEPTPPSDSLEKVDWIRSRPANHYTLQLLGVEHVQALEDFVATYGLQDRAFYYVTRRKGKPWYPLLWGDFPDKKSAIVGSEQLPAEVRKKGYWIRQFREIQKQLDKN
jgi:septal ring-binding cell division protein DamX